MAQGIKLYGKKARWGTAQGTRTTSVNTRNVPVDVRSQFKAFCARRGYTMEAAIIALMRKSIREDTRLPEARPKKLNEGPRYTDTDDVLGQAAPL